jgi:hypothetical protein
MASAINFGSIAQLPPPLGLLSGINETKKKHDPNAGKAGTKQEKQNL